MKSPAAYYRAIPARARINLEVFVATVLVAVAVLGILSMIGCAGLPVQGSDPPEIPYYVPGTDAVMFTASPAGAVATGGWMGLALKAVGLVTGTSGLLSLASSNGRKALSVVTDPEAGWLPSAQALGHALSFGTVPPPAPAAEDKGPVGLRAQV